MGTILNQLKMYESDDTEEQFTSIPVSTNYSMGQKYPQIYAFKLPKYLKMHSTVSLKKYIVYKNRCLVRMFYTNLCLKCSQKKPDWSKGKPGDQKVKEEEVEA